MIIEFIGAPGAGKTSLLPAATEQLVGMGYRPATVTGAGRAYAARTVPGRIVTGLAPPRLRAPLLWQVFAQLSALNRVRFAARHPMLVRHVLASQRGRPASAAVRERRVLYWFFHSGGCYEFLTRRRRADEVLLLDEGFVHRVVQLYASSDEEPRAERIAAYVRLLPRPDLTILIDARPEVCEERVYQRGLWAHLQSRSTPDVARFVRHAHRAVHMAVAHAERAGWPVLRVDNSGDLATAARDLRAGLAALPGVARAPQAERRADAPPGQRAGGELC